MKNYILSFVLLALGCMSFVLYSLSGSYVDENGMLIESFGYIPAGFFFIVSGLLSGLVISLWRAFHTPTHYDKWMLGLFFTLCFLFTSYITLSMLYLSENAMQEVL